MTAANPETVPAPRARHVLIVEPHLFGHHFSYLRWLVEGGLGAGHTVLVGTSEESTSNSRFRQWYAGLDNRVALITNVFDVDTQPVRKVWQLAKKEFRYFNFFKTIFQKAADKGATDWVLVPYFDYFIQACALNGSPFDTCPWSTIWMRSSWAYSPSGMRDRFRFFAARRAMAIPQLRTVHTIDPLLRDALKTRWPERIHRKLEYVTDPAEASLRLPAQEARSALGLSAKSTIILAYGALTSRKGIADLIAAIDRSDSSARLIGLLVGRSDPQTGALLSGDAARRLLADGRLKLYDDYADAQMERLAFSAADIVWLGYRRHLHMSGVLVQAGQAGLPVLASNEGLIAWFTRSYNTGLIIDLGDNDSIDSAIIALCDSRDLRIQLGRNGQDIFSSHTPDNFATTLFRSICQSPPASMTGRQ